MAQATAKKQSTTQPQVVMKTQGSVVNPLYLTCSGQTRKVMIPSRVQCELERIALELQCLPEEVAVAWLEQMLELHN
jgi:hypothetical protein